jgi:uncharacterized membrane protein
VSEVAKLFVGLGIVIAITGVGWRIAELVDAIEAASTCPNLLAEIDASRSLAGVGERAA